MLDDLGDAGTAHNKTCYYLNFRVKMLLVSATLDRVEPWCSGLTCLPVTQETAGSNPVGSAINLTRYNYT